VKGLYTKLTLSDKEIVYSELCVRDYKTILKCLLGTSIDIPILFLNLNNILVNITNLTKEELFDLNIIEYFLLLLKIRMTSIGSVIFATYNGERKINLQISLFRAIEELETFLLEYTPVTFNVKNLTYKLVLPKIKDFITDNVLTFIEDSANINFDQLPINVYKTINKNINLFKESINSMYFFNPVDEKYVINFSSNLAEYTSLIKILYNENLLSVYDNIFYLCKTSNFSADYLESCTYGEFKLFVKKLELMFSNTSNNTDQLPISESEFTPIDIESLYGNGVNITPSEFTP
jgi:hypothetical protein